jgi:hypothetical protein
MLEVKRRGRLTTDVGCGPTAVYGRGGGGAGEGS